MNFRLYLKNSIGKILYFLILILIINTLLFASNPISESINDIIYMDILITLISITFFIFGYYRWKNNYSEYKGALDKGENIEYALPKGMNFESKLLRDTIKQKNSELYEKTMKLEALLTEINDYITQWVHEIKIPISVCDLIADKLSEATDLESVVNSSEDIKMELERIKFLIDQVLYGSRASSYFEDLSIEEVNLNKLVKESIKKNASFFISKKISIELKDLSYNVMTDKKWLSYIISQLLNNSYKYVKENGQINIWATEDDKSVKLMIKDNGVGIEQKDINRIFDKGFTGENGRRTTKSTGMGLYFTKKMLNKLGHEISVSSLPNRYTEFTITFYKLSDYYYVTKM